MWLIVWMTIYKPIIMEKQTSTQSTQQEVINNELSDEQKKAEHPSTQQEVINELSDDNDTDDLTMQKDKDTVLDPSTKKKQNDGEEEEDEDELVHEEEEDDELDTEEDRDID
jgi:hypothetical protein